MALAIFTILGPLIIFVIALLAYKDIRNKKTVGTWTTWSVATIVIIVVVSLLIRRFFAEEVSVYYLYSSIIPMSILTILAMTDDLYSWYHRG